MTETEVPAALEELIGAWRAAGSAAQRSITWPRERWTSGLPEYTDLFEALPDRLDRDEVRRA